MRESPTYMAMNNSKYQLKYNEEQPDRTTETTEWQVFRATHKDLTNNAQR